MSRGLSVFFGVILISTVWLWMLISIDFVPMSWWAIVELAVKSCTACFVTGPVYREYLR